jgi:hypothetical protein
MAYSAGKTVDSTHPVRRGNQGWKFRAPTLGNLSVYSPIFILNVLLTAALATGSQTSVFSDPLPTRFRVQGRFIAALDRPISGSWKGVSLRSILRRLSREREIAILIDRRVDPDQELEIDTGERSLRAAVDAIARQGHLAVSQLGNCLVLGPPAATRRLRTLAALRERELLAAELGFSDRMIRLRTERSTIRWDDLEHPADIVRMIGRQFGLSITGIEQIPHDLWAGAVAPGATATEALSIVLNQFDLTFEWTDRGAGVRVVDIPATVAIERSYALHGRPAGETLRSVHSKIEGLDAEIRGGKLVVRGPVEQHEMVAAILGLSKGPTRKEGKPPSTSLEKQSFSLQAHGVGLRDLFEELRKQGLTIQYDPDELRNAGIDLTQKVAIDLPQLPAPQFLNRLLNPYGLTFHFSQRVVVIEPK